MDLPTGATGRWYAAPLIDLGSRKLAHLNTAGHLGEETHRVERPIGRPYGFSEVWLRSDMAKLEATGRRFECKLRLQNRTLFHSRNPISKGHPVKSGGRPHVAASND